MTIKRIAIATLNNKGLDDIISNTFGYSKTFTIIDIEDGNIKDIKIIDNPAGSMTHGRGPVIAQKLSDMNVEIVISSELGPCVLEILKEFGISTINVKPRLRVLEVLKENGLIK
jgi:predicted Fe-Mo cluster-binding NifX family protein